LVIAQYQIKKEGNPKECPSGKSWIEFVPEHYFKVPATVNETPKQDFNIYHVIIELRNISRCVHTAVIMEPSI
jgi:hypothetical protein